MTTDLQTVGAMHQCKKGELYSTCIHCGAIAEKLNSPCPNYMRQVASHGQAPAQPAATWKPPGIGALMCVISSLRDTAHFSDEEGEVTNDLRALRDWASSVATPTPQADSQPAPANTNKTPTDEEILDAAEEFRSQYMHGGTTFDDFDALGFARAVLAKWGSPVVAVEPVAWQYRSVRDNGLWFDCTEKRAKQRAAHPETWDVRYLYATPQPTPQPTQAQAGAVDDTALIQQMLDAAITIYPHLNGLAVASDEALALLQQQIAAITAARARLKEIAQ